MPHVPHFDLPGQHAGLEDELLSAVRRVLRHGGFILGSEVARLEASLAEYVGVHHVVGVSSGTDALVLALRGHGIGPGDEVITVAHSFVATALAVRLVGAEPVFVDIDADTMVMDAGALQAKVTPRTRAVIPVHLNGFPCDLEAISAFTRAHQLVLIEDCAQAFGTRFHGRHVGSTATGCFSLHPLKTLGGCGDGGFVTTQDGGLAQCLRELRNLGLRDRDHCEHISGNHRLDALQAALVAVKLPHVPRWIEARRAHAAAYRTGLDARLVLPPDEGAHYAVYSAFVVRHPHRDALLRALAEAGVDAKVHYPLAIHQQTPFSRPHLRLPVTERVVNEIISLPISEQLTEAKRNHVVSSLNRALQSVTP